MVERFRLVAIDVGTVRNEVDEEVLSTTPDTEFRSGNGLWIFNLRTKDLDVTYFCRIVLIDGSRIEFQFGLK